MPRSAPAAAAASRSVRARGPRPSAAGERRSAAYAQLMDCAYTLLLVIIPKPVMQLITLSIDDDLARSLDRHMKKHRYASRSEALRDILREAQAREQLEERQAATDDGAFCVATLAYVYDHETRDL